MSDVYPRPRNRRRERAGGSPPTSAPVPTDGPYVVRLVKGYGKCQAGNYAAGLAFNAFMSMFPLILGVLSILGFVISDAHTRAQVEQAVLGFFPGDSHGAVKATLDGVRRNAGIFGLVALLGMLWGGTSLFSSMEFALDRIFGVEQRGFVRQRLMGLCMTAVFAVALVGTVFVNSAVSLIGGLSLLGPVLGAAVWIVFALTIYRFVPNHTYSASEIWRGALLAGILMEAISLLWPLYAGLTHGFNTYGSAFALFFLLATYLYLISQCILAGAVANRIRLGEPQEPGLLAHGA